MSSITSSGYPRTPDTRGRYIADRPGHYRCGMVRRSVRIAVALAALALAVGPAAAAVAVPADARSASRDAAASVTALPADVDDFTFASFDAVYELSRDAGRSLGARHDRDARRRVPRVRPEPRHPARHPAALRRASDRRRCRVGDGCRGHAPPVRDRARRGGRVPPRHGPSRRLRARRADLRDPLPPAQRHVRARRRGHRRVLLGRERHRLGAALRTGASRAADVGGRRRGLLRRRRLLSRLDRVDARRASRSPPPTRRRR